MPLALVSGSMLNLPSVRPVAVDIVAAFQGFDGNDAATFFLDLFERLRRFQSLEMFVQMPIERRQKPHRQYGATHRQNTHRRR